MSHPHLVESGKNTIVNSWRVPVNDWHPAAHYTVLAQDALEIFSPNHVGFFVFYCPLPQGAVLEEFSCTLRYLAPEDYDFAGLAINYPPHKKNLFGLSRRNGTFEAGTLYKGPFDVQLETPYLLTLRQDSADFDSPVPWYRFFVNGQDLAGLQTTITHVGVFANEAHVRLEKIHVTLRTA